MNLFACEDNPVEAAKALPDKHVCKMCIENAQMLAVAVGDVDGLGWGTLRKKDGTPYSQKAHINHPSTKWVRASYGNLAWTIIHGLALCDEFEHRFGKPHASKVAHLDAKALFEANKPELDLNSHWELHQTFARAMPEEIKFDKSIDSITAYRKYLTLNKPWAAWTRDESRKPTWWNPSLYQECRSQSTESHTSKMESLSTKTSMTSSKKP
jgi:hypothetical protein